MHRLSLLDSNLVSSLILLYSCIFFLKIAAPHGAHASVLERYRDTVSGCNCTLPQLILRCPPLQFLSISTKPEECLAHRNTVSIAGLRLPIKQHTQLSMHHAYAMVHAVRLQRRIFCTSATTRCVSYLNHDQ